MRLALYQPDIPQNTGTLLRTSACLGVGVDLIEPLGFVMSDRRLKRAGMDYLDQTELTRHASWDAFLKARESSAGRLVLLTTQADCMYGDFEFGADDTLLLGSEGSGVPENVHAIVDARIRIPMDPAARSLNVAVAGAMVLGEALRQTDGFIKAG